MLYQPWLLTSFAHSVTYRGLRVSAVSVKKKLHTFPRFAARGWQHMFSYSSPGPSGYDGGDGVWT